jgi:hypothetical protein
MWKNIEKDRTEINNLYDIFSNLHGKDSKTLICNILLRRKKQKKNKKNKKNKPACLLLKISLC